MSRLGSFTKELITWFILPIVSIIDGCYEFTIIWLVSWGIVAALIHLFCKSVPWSALYAYLVMTVGVIVVLFMIILLGSSITRPFENNGINDD